LRRAAALTNIQTFFESHPMNVHSDWETRGIPYQLQLCDKEFLRHCLTAMRLCPRTEISRAAALLLRCASNVSYVNAAIMDPSVKGVKQILDAISSTSHDNTTLLNLVTCISNIAAFDDAYILRIAEESGLELLQPVVLHDDVKISLRACRAVASIACLKDCAELVEKSQSLLVVENVLRSVTPGTLLNESQWSNSDSKMLLRMMSADAGVAVQLTALQSIGSSFHQQQNVEFFNTPICHVREHTSPFAPMNLNMRSTRNAFLTPRKCRERFEPAPVPPTLSCTRLLFSSCASSTWPSRSIAPRTCLTRPPKSTRFRS
jgi:hypothetical protein